MKNYTDNLAYNRHLYNITHAWNREQLEAERFAVCIDTEIDSFDMANDLYSRIEYKELFITD